MSDSVFDSFIKSVYTTGGGMSFFDNEYVGGFDSIEDADYDDYFSDESNDESKIGAGHGPTTVINISSITDEEEIKKENISPTTKINGSVLPTQNDYPPLVTNGEKRPYQNYNDYPDESRERTQPYDQKYPEHPYDQKYPEQPYDQKYPEQPEMLYGASEDIIGQVSFSLNGGNDDFDNQSQSLLSTIDIKLSDSKSDDGSDSKSDDGSDSKSDDGSEFEKKIAGNEVLDATMVRKLLTKYK